MIYNKLEASYIYKMLVTETEFPIICPCISSIVAGISSYPASPHPAGNCACRGNCCSDGDQ
jgi:hypothetical protein